MKEILFFINKPLSEMEDKAFSNFLKTRKAKALQKKKKKIKRFKFSKLRFARLFNLNFFVL